ncbi:MAG: hypothetical protein QG646_584 [Euryarchaeota archaeon]|nr:hypothetical protein [Euryarchaeota archaeon]
MQKNMIKAIGVFTLVLFVLSVTGAAAATCKSCTACKPCKANSDYFSFSKSKTCGNVLKNDVGNSKQVTTIGTIATSKGGKVTMDKNGNFCYKPSTCSKTGVIKDSFKYTIKCSCPKTCNCKQPSTATVNITYRCS